MTPKKFGLFTLFLAVILIPKYSSANLLDFFTNRNENLSKEEEDSIKRDLSRLIDDVADTFSQVVNEVKSAAGKVADGVKSTVDGAIYDAAEVFGTLVSRFNPTIFPGTNWCGAGDRARGSDDFGVFGTADHCCRAHDSCQEVIPAGETRHGLRNVGEYTLSHCECDEAFYWCLKNSSSLVAKKIGVTFFNILGMRCYKYDYPMVCAFGESSYECDHYEQDRSANKEWQWVNARSF